MIAAIGGVAGIIGAVGVHPLEVLRTRVTVEKEKTVREAYNSVMRNNGWKGFSVGLIPSVLGSAAISSLTYSIYDTFVPMLPRSSDGSGAPTVESELTLKLYAARLSQCLLYPAECIRRRAMVEADGRGVSMIASGLSCVRTAGWTSLYTGLNANLWKISPSVLVSHFVYHGGMTLSMSRH